MCRYCTQPPFEECMEEIGVYGAAITEYVFVCFLDQVLRSWSVSCPWHQHLTVMEKLISKYKKEIFGEMYFTPLRLFAVA